MFYHGFNEKVEHIGFISTRLQGTDGVSLETEKWVSVFEKMGFTCFFFAGLSNWDKQKTFISPKAFWEHPEVAEVQSKIFGTKYRDEELTGKIHKLRNALKKDIYHFIKHYKIEVLVVENALAIPMNVPLGLAITEVIAETGIPTIAHHHDFYWERTRFLLNSVPEFISMAFPPKMHSMAHVVINSEARKSLSYRRGLSSVVVPNVHNYNTPAPSVDDFNSTFREDIGLKEDDILFLQPTRIVARKGIEHSIELLKRLDNPKAKLLISHQAQDEGKEYAQRIKAYSKLMNVDTIIRPDIIGADRSIDKNGQKTYSLWDIYPHADFITYPSLYEGFGNAFLEAIYFKKPLLVNRYSIFVQDIEPLGFDAVVMDTYITDETVKQVNSLLYNHQKRDEITEKNYALAQRFFSYTVLEQKLKTLLLELGIVDKTFCG